jgi:predicted nicotinamide N-methyase
VVLRFHLSSCLPSGASIVPIISLPFRVTCSTNSTVSSSSEASTLELKANEDSTSHCKSEEVRRSTIMTIGESTCASCIRESRVGDVTVYVLESPGLLGIGGKVWDSTFVLVDFLRKKGLSFISGKRVVELGSGTGISGVFVTSPGYFPKIPNSYSFSLFFITPISILRSTGSLLINYSLNMIGLGLCNFNPKSVILTDFAEVVPLIQSNIELNCLMLKGSSHQNCIRSQYFAAPLCWGTDLGLAEGSSDTAGTERGGSSVTATEEGMSSAVSKVSFECDLVIASDVVYDPIGYEPLVQTLCELLKGKYRKPSSDSCASVDKGADASSPSDDSSLSVAVSGGVKHTHIDQAPPPQFLSHCASRPICILAHRHRHPENQRFELRTCLHMYSLYLCCRSK